MKIVIASANLQKVREFRSLLTLFPHWEVLWMSHFPQLALPEETGNSFQENAKAKALYVSQALNCYALGDDSGLVVPSLNGEPGILSSRYAGEKATDRDNCQKLLKKMSSLEGESRHAYFECALALAGPQGIIKSTVATCEGFILPKERGNGGFGYDALFVKHDYDKSFAELSESVKNRISHRYKAFERLLSTLHTLR
ncbi:Non-canonical purine NTP pyrophosphatase [Chlamydiales bacterium STE3]|nr:Non-canonical purine NTP pyrophosphatase [Chlamydiales bacterium STE3]